MLAKGRRLQSLVWDMAKNTSEDFQAVWLDSMSLQSCIEPVPLAKNSFKQVRPIAFAF